MRTFLRCALAIALSSAFGSGCLIYSEDLLLDAPDGGAGGEGGAMGGGGSGGCTGTCLHLLLSEVVIAPTPAEYVEVYNPLDETVSLDDVWLSDMPTYFEGDGQQVAGTDFLVRFRPGTTIDAGQRLAIAIDSAASFAGVFTDTTADYDFQAMDGEAGSTAGLSNSGELVVLFQWDGVSALVRDLDYVVWGDVTERVDKTGVARNGETYADDTPAENQSSASPPPSMMGIQRCGDTEAGETLTGGNGVIGHDETSEDMTAWRTGDATPQAGFPGCP